MIEDVKYTDKATKGPENNANLEIASGSTDDSVSIHFAFSNIKLRTCQVRELMNLSPALNKFSSQKSDFSYLCRKTCVLSPEAIMALLLLCPILVSKADNQFRVLAGTRMWAIALATLPPTTKISVLELKQCNKRVESLLAMLDYYVCRLFFSLSKAAIKLLQSSFKFFDKEQRNDAIYLVPGIKTIDELAIATGVRTETTRKDRQTACKTAKSDD